MGADLVEVGLAQPAEHGSDAASATGARRALWVCSISFVALLGLALRLWSLGRAPINSDEAVVGLMAREILHGHLFAFYWGQTYGGVEPYLTAALFGVFGQSSFALSMTAVVLDAAAALLLWRIGARLLGPAVGAAAALSFWVWPEVYVHQSTIEYGFRWAALVLGLTMLLATVRLTSSELASRRRALVVADWTLLGGCAGLGWWATPEIAYFVLPCAVVVAYAAVRRGLRPPLLGVLPGVAAAILGALPWLWDNVGHGFPSLAHSPQGAGNAGFVHHLRILVEYVLPMVLGLRLRGSGSWLFFAPLAKIAYAIALVVLAGFLVDLALRRRAAVLVVFCVLAPLVYAYSPFTWYWTDGRYGIFLAPAAALVLAGALWRLAGALGLLGRTRRSGAAGSTRYARAGAAAAVLACAALTVGAAARIEPYRQSAGRDGALSWSADPNSYLAPTIATLEHAGVRGVYAGYWVGYDLAFEARGRLVVGDLAFDRYPPYLVELEMTERTAWLFPDPARLSVLEHDIATPLLAPGCIGASACLEIGQLQRYLASTNDPYRTLQAGDFLAVLPRYPALAPEVYATAGIRA